MPKIKPETKKQAFGFSVVTGLGTGIDFLFLWILTEIVMLGVMISATISFLISVLWNYSMLRWKTFPQCSIDHKTGLFRYCTIAFGSLGVNTISMFFFAQYLGWNTFLAKAITTILVFGWSFPMNKFWTFK